MNDQYPGAPAFSELAHIAAAHSGLNTPRRPAYRQRGAKQTIN